MYVVIVISEVSWVSLDLATLVFSDAFLFVKMYFLFVNKNNVGPFYVE